MISGYLVNPIGRRRMPARRKRRANPVRRRRKAPVRRRRTSTRAGMPRKTARRAYRKTRPNPVRRRRSVRRNPAGDILQNALMVGLGAAVAQFAQTKFIDEANMNADGGQGEGSRLPAAVQEGWGRAVLVMGIGATVAVLSDRAKSGSAIKKFGPAFGAGWVANGLAYGIREMMAKQYAAPQGSLYSGGSGSGRERITVSDVRMNPAHVASNPAHIAGHSAADAMAGLYSGNVSNII